MGKNVGIDLQQQATRCLDNFAFVQNKLMLLKLRLLMKKNCVAF
jgi:hypothetical protein